MHKFHPRAIEGINQNRAEILEINNKIRNAKPHEILDHVYGLDDHIVNSFFTMLDPENKIKVCQAFEKPRYWHLLTKISRPNSNVLVEILPPEDIISIAVKMFEKALAIFFCRLNDENKKYFVDCQNNKFGFLYKMRKGNYRYIDELEDYIKGPKAKPANIKQTDRKITYEKTF